VKSSKSSKCWVNLAIFKCPWGRTAPERGTSSPLMTCRRLNGVKRRRNGGGSHTRNRTESGLASRSRRGICQQPRITARKYSAPIIVLVLHTYLLFKAVELCASSAPSPSRGWTSRRHWAPLKQCGRPNRGRSPHCCTGPAGWGTRRSTSSLAGPDDVGTHPADTPWQSEDE